MAQSRITKNDLIAMCDDIAATFPDAHYTNAVDAMTRLITERLNKLEWMERSQLEVALLNIKKWYEMQSRDEQEHFRKVFEYVENKLMVAYKLPPWQQRL